MSGGVAGEVGRPIPLCRYADGIRHENESDISVISCAKKRSCEQLGEGEELRGRRPGSLGSMLCRQFGQTLTMPFGRGDHFHLLPVVRKFSAAVKTSYVRPS
jgi:hypothetical protein